MICVNIIVPDIQWCSEYAIMLLGKTNHDILYLSGLFGEGVSFQVRRYPTFYATCVDNCAFIGAVDLSGGVNDVFKRGATFRPVRGSYQPGTPTHGCPLNVYIHLGCGCLLRATQLIWAPEDMNCHQHLSMFSH